MEYSRDITNFYGDSEDGEAWQSIIRSLYGNQVPHDDHLLRSDSTNLISSEQNPQMMNQTTAQTEPLGQRQSAELTPPDSLTSNGKFSEITAVDPRTSKKREYDRAYRLRIKEQRTSVEAENAVLKHEIESLKNKVASLSQERDEFKKENVELKQKLIKKSEKIEQLKSDLKIKEVENGELTNDLIKSLKERNALMNQPFETQSNEPDQRRSEDNIEKQFRVAGSSTNFTRDFGQYSIVETEGRSMHSTAVAVFKVFLDRQGNKNITLRYPKIWR